MKTGFWECDLHMVMAYTEGAPVSCSYIEKSKEQIK